MAVAENLEGLIQLLQPGRLEKLHFVRLIWTPGLAVARTIVVGAERFVTDTGHALGQHWFGAGIDVLEDLIVAEATRLKSPTWSHPELIARLKGKENREADRFAAGMF
ncbi:hypothetical protein [Mesorhizobium sangaii]|uniref:Uncharacterized protein n=1 Tax=Mesorhizobium sangaii TaxID=505389 RepID=A0A841PU08_9HYPH|nr:hypothetical protein [Mesorhizobium sangaii]MBB6413522.1 hypothetical protein [Mesorhizobium sangaii]